MVQNQQQQCRGAEAELEVAQDVRDSVSSLAGFEKYAPVAAGY
jgi:hypothetical protein